MTRRMLTTLSVLFLIMGLGFGSFGAGAQEEGGGGGSGSLPGARRRPVLESGWVRGLSRLEEEGAEIAYTERVNQSQQVEVFRNYAQQGTTSSSATAASTWTRHSRSPRSTWTSNLSSRTATRGPTTSPHLPSATEDMGIPGRWPG